MRIATCISFLACTLLAGCGYQLQGRVVQGGFGTISLVNPNDPRLQGEGVSGVRVQLVRDPNRMRREVIAEGSSDSAGNFSLETKTFGAGWMDERFQILASRGGFGSAQSSFELPMDASSRRVLVELQRGAASGAASPTGGSGTLYDEAAKYDPTMSGKSSGQN